MLPTKNVIAAIVMSTCVIVLYSLYFAPSPDEVKKLKAEQEEKRLVQDLGSGQLSKDARFWDGEDWLPIGFLLSTDSFIIACVDALEMKSK